MKCIKVFQLKQCFDQMRRQSKIAENFITLPEKQIFSPFFLCIQDGVSCLQRDIKNASSIFQFCLQCLVKWIFFSPYNRREKVSPYYFLTQFLKIKWVGFTDKKKSNFPCKIPNFNIPFQLCVIGINMNVCHRK